jgi:flagellar FliL protein
VLTVYFPYPARDSAFEEELTGKNRAIRRVILEWFASRTLEEITAAGEKQVKDQLLEEINRLFVLGRINTLYFGDYLVLE